MPKSPVKPVTSLQDLADIAGVSRATVSRALNDSPLVNEKTKARLHKLAAKHAYQINQRARDFRLQKTSVIAVVFMLDTNSKQHMSDPFFLAMLGAVADSLAEHDYDLLLTHSTIADVRDLAKSRALRQCDGAIFIGQGKQHDQLNELVQQDARIVVWGFPVAEKHYTVVGSDNVGGGYQATHHLLDYGRRRIAFFGDTGNPETAARYAGHCKALTDFGVAVDPTLQATVPFDIEGARTVVGEALDTMGELDAIMCVSDVIALATISMLQERGFKVPDDVAVTGYDNIELAICSNPPLTSVSQNIEQAGRVLVDSLMQLIHGAEVPDTILRSRLVVRKSSGERRA